MNQDIYARLGAATEAIYNKIEDSVSGYRHSLLDEHASQLIRDMKILCASFPPVRGELLTRELANITTLRQIAENSLPGKYPKFCWYVRGASDQGKSTLINALLEVGSEQGAALDTGADIPVYIYYSDELSPTKAQVVNRDQEGNLFENPTSRSDANTKLAQTRSEYMKSVESCRQTVNSICAERTLDYSAPFFDSQSPGDAPGGAGREISRSEKKRIFQDVFREKLRQPKIFSVTYGTGANDILKDAILADTPGLNSELQLPVPFRDLDYFGGNIWVIRSDMLYDPGIVNDYIQEITFFRDSIGEKPSIMVINLVFEDVRYDPRANALAETNALNRGRELFSRYFRDIICVNARFAYEGILHSDFAQVEVSRIGLLREAMSELCIRINSTEHLRERIDITGSVAQNYYAMLEAYKNGDPSIMGTEELAMAYDTIGELLGEQLSYCCDGYIRRRDGIIEYFLEVYYSKIGSQVGDQHIRRMDKMLASNPTEYGQWVLDTLLDGTLKQELDKSFISAAESLYESYAELRRSFFISEYRDDDYAVSVFESNGFLPPPPPMPTAAPEPDSTMALSELVSHLEKYGNSERTVSRLRGDTGSGNYVPKTERLKNAIRIWAGRIAEVYDLAETVEKLGRYYDEEYRKVSLEKLYGKRETLDKMSELFADAIESRRPLSLGTLKVDKIIRSQGSL